jgi:hypothetical protein
MLDFFDPIKNRIPLSLFFFPVRIRVRVFSVFLLPDLDLLHSPAPIPMLIYSRITRRRSSEYNTFHLG